MSKIFSLIFFYNDTNYYCLIRPNIDNNKVEYHVSLRFVDFGLELREEYILREENGEILNDGSESTLRKKTIAALNEQLLKRSHLNYSTENYSKLKAEIR